MSIPSIIVGRSNWAVKPGKLLGYANSQDRIVPREFAVTRALDTATRINSDGYIELVPANVPRVDFLGGQRRLLVEPSGTNSIRNNSMSGAVTGTPGTLPTGGGWTTTLRGLTQTVVGTGTENGINYIDIRFSGTATSTDSVEIRYESTTQIVASSGQTWTHSVYLKKIVEPNPPNNYQLSIYERDSGGNLVVFGASTIAPTTTIQRFTQTRTLSGALTARVQPALLFNVTNGQTYNFTIRIGYPQMELSSVATSVIPTTTGAVTRNADVISLTGVAGLIGQTEGTLYAEVDFRTSGKSVAVSRVIELTDGTNANRVIIAFGSDTQLLTRVTAASVEQASFTATVAFGILKIAFAYSSLGCVLYVNGTNVQSNASATIPATNRVNLGFQGTTSSSQLNDRITTAEIYPTRLTNAELAALTAL